MPPETRWRIVCAVLLLAVYYGGLAFYPLIPPDEARYAEIPREMLERGDFVTPTLNYVAYLEKPPLSYWLTASALAAFGNTTLSARLWPCTLALLTVLAVYGLGRRLDGERAGFAAALALGAFPLWFVAGHLSHIDPVLASTLTLSLLAFLAVESGRLRRGPGLFAFYAFAALATLAKGLIGVVLPGAIVALYLVLSRRLGQLRRLGLAWGAPLYLAITTPWFFLVSARNPDFLRFFFIHEHWQRFTSDVAQRSAGPWYLPGVLLVGTLPFTPLLWLAIRRSLRAARASLRGEPDPDLFLLVWASVIFVFFWMSHSQLAFYVLPVLPALALLIGRHVAHASGGSASQVPGEAWARRLLFLLCVAGLGFVIVGPTRLGLPDVHLRLIVLPAVAATALVLWLVPRRVDPPLLRVGMACLMLLAGMQAAGQAVITEQRSSGTLGAEIRRRAAPGDLVVHFQQYHQDAAFYGAERAVVVGNDGELRFGHRQDDDSAKWFWSARHFLDEWHQGKPMWVILDAHRLSIRAPGTHGRPLAQALGRYREVAHSGEYVLVTNTEVDPSPGARPSPDGAS